MTGHFLQYLTPAAGRMSPSRRRLPTGVIFVFALNRIALWSAALAAPALLIAPAAAAETLIYITDTTIGTVDTSAPSADDTSSNSGSGPLNYTLPDGSALIGAKVMLENSTLYLLVAADGMCQLYSVDAVGSNGSASLSKVNPSYSCAPAPGTGDFAFRDGSMGSSDTDAYLVPTGDALLQVPAGGGAPTSIPVTNEAGTAANVWGLADKNTSPSDTLYGVDATDTELFQLNLGAATASEDNNPISAPVQFSGYASFDYSITSQTLYLYTGGTLYAYGGTPYPNALSDGDLSNLGSMPAGTLVMAVANGASVSNNGGALSPATLLPLLVLALLRRRRLAVA